MADDDASTGGEPPEPARTPRLGRAERAVRAVAVAALTAGVFATGLATGLILHLDLPLTKRVVAGTVNALFATLFDGEVRLGAVEEITLESIVVTRFEAHAPTGERVIDVEGIRIRGFWLPPVIGLAVGGGKGTLGLDNVRVERGFVGLQIAEGVPLPLAAAFGTGPSEPAPPKPSAEPFTLEVRTLELGEVTVAGTLAPSVPIDATVSRLRAQLRVGEEGITVDVDRSAIEERAIVGAPLRGSADFHLTGRFADEARSLSMWGTFGGHLAELQLLVDVLIVDGEVRASIDLPRVGQKELATWVPDAPLTRPVSARLGLSGLPPELALTGTVILPAIAGAEPGRIGIDGLLVADDRVTVDAVVDVDELDARLLSTELPATALSLRAEATVAFEGADTAVRVVVDGEPGRWGELAVPPIEGIVSVAGSQVAAELVVEEAGATTDVHARYDPRQGLAFAARSHVPSLAAVPRLAALLGGRGYAGRATARTSGRYRPGGEGEVDVYAEAEVAGVRLPGSDVSVGNGRVFGRLRGPSQRPERLRLDATVIGGDANLGGTELERFVVRAAGPLARPTVEADVLDRLQRRVVAKGVVEPEARQLRGVTVQIDAGPVGIRGEVDRVASIGEALTVDGLRLTGLGGEVSGGLAIERGELVGKLEGTGIDLASLSRMVGAPLPVRGRANLSVDLERAPGGRRGHVQVRVQDGGILLVDGVELSLDTQFDGRLVEAEAALTVANPLRHEDEAHPCAGRVVTVTLEDAETALVGPLLDPTTWRDSDYEAMVGLESVKLRCLAEIWQEASPMAPIPVTEVAGLLDASFGLAVDADEPHPSLTHMGVRTTGLVVAGRPDEPDAAPPWKTDELDLAVVGSIDGATGDATLSVALLDDDHRVADNLSRPPLVRLDAAMALELDALLAGGERARSSLENSKMSVALETTRSPFARWAALPSPFRELPPQLGGDVEVDVYLEGTARDPSIAGRARVWGLEPPRVKGKRGIVNNDLDLMINYQGGVGRVDGTLHRDGELALEISGESLGNLSTRVLGGQSDPAWTGWLRAELEGMQLSTIPPLAKIGMKGNVTGRVEVRDLGAEPRAVVDLSIDGLAVGPQLRFGKSKLRLQPLDDGKGGMGLLVELPLERGGGLRVSGYGGLDWEDRLYPKPAVERAAGLYVIADRFPLATARPLMPDAVAGLAGNLDGELRVGYKEKSTSEISVDADMWLRDGAAQLVPLGQDFHGITAHVTARGGLVKVDELELRSGTGRATGSLRAGLDGLGLNVVTGSILIDEAEPFPVASEGVPLGNVTGQVDANVSVRTDGIQALLVTRGVRLQLPPSANRDVQELEGHPDVRVAQPLYAPKPDDEDDTGASTPLTLTILLSPTEIVGNQVRIAFLTEAPLTVRDDGVVKGEIVVTDGELTVLDKTFRVDRGRVLLREEEPGNPFLNVTAHWDAPDGTTVYVDYVGPLKPMDRENFTFRSQPALPESEVLALLIFGDASAGATGADQTNSVANSVAAAQFNAVLGQLAPGLSTKISTNSATLTYQLTDKVTVSATFENQQGTGQQQDANTTSSGGNPNDATNRSEFSIDYRFAKSWLVRGTVGVGLGAASGIDLLFQHRY